MSTTSIEYLEERCHELEIERDAWADAAYEFMPTAVYAAAEKKVKETIEHEKDNNH